MNKFEWVNNYKTPYWIKLYNCQHGFLYHIAARNFCLGVFNESTKSFFGIRYKFGNQYIDDEYHWDTGEPYGTAKPLQLLGKSPFPDISDPDQLFEWLQSMENIATDEQILALKLDAIEGNELKLILLCEMALGGDIAARIECTKIVRQEEASNYLVIGWSNLNPQERGFAMQLVRDGYLELVDGKLEHGKLLPEE